MADDSNDASDVFVRDLQTETTELVSQATRGSHGNGSSTRPTISADGRYVAFDSLASNLVARDTNQYGDVFFHDRKTGLTIRVSISNTRKEGNQHSSNPAISGDGRHVAFDSAAWNLVVNDTPYDARDVFVHDVAGPALSPR